MDTRRVQSPPVASPGLTDLLRKAAKHKMTRAEIEAQRRSRVIGELMLEHPDWTREHAEALYDRVTGESP